MSPSSVNWGGSNQPLGAGTYADGLIPFVDPETNAAPTTGTLRAQPFSVAIGTNQPIWVDVFVPPTAAAGLYSGNYTVTSDQGNFTGQVALTVYNFTLPVKPFLNSGFGIGRSTSAAVYREMLRHRVAPFRVGPANESWAVPNFGLSQTHMGYFSGADNGNCSMQSPPSVTTLRSAASQHTPGLMLYNFTADEIGHCPSLYPMLRQWAYNLHQAGINNLVTISPRTELYDDGSGTGRSAVDIWALLPVLYNQNPSGVSYVLSKGDKVWSTNALVQDGYSPKWMVDFSPMNVRIQPGFINQSLGLTGLLYWQADRWVNNPWTNINTVGVYSTNNYPGEGILIYPGADVGVQGAAPTIRLKWLRDGIEDYDYIAMLKQAGYGSWALTVASGVGRDWTNWTKDPNVLESARTQLANQLAGTQPVAPAPTPTPTPATTAPAAPASPTPTSAATGVSTGATLTWDAVTGATSYDVYFGTSTTPGLVGSSSTASYKPASMAASTRYYWRVVAKNTAGSASSVTWSFTTAATTPTTSPTPTTGSRPVSVSPASGTGLDVAFTATFTDAAGVNSLSGVHVLFNSSNDTAGGCWAYYQSGANTLWLANDAGSGWTSAIVGSAVQLSNSRCILYVGSTTATKSGTTLTLRLPVTFKSLAFKGSKGIFAQTTGSSGTSGYMQLGSWIVP